MDVCMVFKMQMLAKPTSKNWRQQRPTVKLPRVHLHALTLFGLVRVNKKGKAEDLGLLKQKYLTAFN